ncbi:MAG TPA: hypothetical protein VN316_01885 [candidate division Zixibacteria bacterium]|nr:hypothetical protein [candidate division Zixibacteria bacterium]
MPDGGYIIAGRTTSYGAGKAEKYFAGIYAAWLIKTDPNGEERWNRTYGKKDTDWWVRRVQQTSYNGYMLSGGTLNKDGRSRALLIKTDLNGNEQWNRTFGGIDKGPSDLTDAYVQQTSDAGFILAASIFNNTKSYGKAKADALLIKIDANGNERWNKTFGGSNDTWVSSVHQTKDGGFIITGKIRSYDAQENWIGDDVWLLKVSGESTKIAKTSLTTVPGETSPEKTAGFEAALAITTLLLVITIRRNR